MDTSSLSTFFSKIVDEDKEHYKLFDNICFISANEWHWTEEQLMNTSIPYIYILLERRTDYIKQQNKR